MSATETEVFGSYHLLGLPRVAGGAEVAAVFGDAGAARLVELRRVRAGGRDDASVPFADAVALAASLSHPCLLAVVDAGQRDGWRYVVTAPPPGRDLARILEVARAEGAPVPVPFVAWMVLCVARALHHLHGRTDAEGRPLGLVHGAVAAASVRVSFEGEVRLVPAGLEEAASGATPLVPEIARGEPAHVGSDLFALAWVAWDALTGRPPYADADAQRLPLPSLRTLRPDAPIELDLVLQRALAVDAARRPATARELGEGVAAAALGDRSVATVREQLGLWLVDRFEDDLVAERELLADAMERVVRARREARQVRRAAELALARSERLGGMLGVGGLALVAAGLLAYDAAGLAEVAAVATPTTGALTLRVEPSARVVIDGRGQGSGREVEVPDLPPGAHEVFVEAEDHLPWQGTAWVVSGGHTVVEATLAPTPKVVPAVLTLDSRPTGATVKVNGALVGRTPTTWRFSPPGGEAHVTFERAGFAPEARTVSGLSPGVRKGVSVVMKPGSGSVAAAATGTLRVELAGAGWATVEIDGVPLGRTTPLGGVRLSAGRHTVRVLNPAAGVDTLETVQVAPGGEVVVRARPR